MDKMHKIIESIEANPVIAAVRRIEDMEDAIKSEVSAIFLLHGEIFTLKEVVERVKESGKSIFLHMDFIDGLGKDNRAIDYIAQVIQPDGIISTRTSQIKYAVEIGLFSIQRFFLVDSLSYETVIKTVNNVQPHMIEIMPGLMTGILKKISQQLHVPLIAGGLIETKGEVIEILKSGAIGASTGKKELWTL